MLYKVRNRVIQAVEEVNAFENLSDMAGSDRREIYFAIVDDLVMSPDSANPFICVQNIEVLS